MDTMMGDEKEEGEHELIGAGYLTHSQAKKKTPAAEYPSCGRKKRAYKQNYTDKGIFLPLLSSFSY